jgi:hypothetical protein
VPAGAAAVTGCRRSSSEKPRTSPPATGSGSLTTKEEVSVERDGSDQKSAGQGFIPKCGDASCDKCLIDGVEQDGTEPGSQYGAAAAEDGHATDHDRRNDQELVAEAGHRAHGGELGEPQPASEAGYASRDHEGEEDPATRRHPCEQRCGRIGADRVEVASRSERTHHIADDQHEHGGDDEYPRDSDDGLVTDADKAAGNAARVYLNTVDDDGIDPADGIERAQRYNQAGYSSDRHDRAVDHAAEQSYEGAGEKAQQDWEVRVVGEEVPDDVGGQTQNRTNRKIDIASDNDQGLADGQDHHDRRPDKKLLNAQGVGEAVVVHGGYAEDGQDHDEDADLAGT